MGYGHATRLRALLRRSGYAQAGETHFGVQARTRVTDYVGYFLSPFDFLNECLTFFLFRAAFKRFVLLRFFMSTPSSVLRNDFRDGPLDEGYQPRAAFRFSTIE